MFGLLGGSALAACTVGIDAPEPLPRNDAWEERAEQLEAASAFLYSAAAEGMWAGKAGTHVPTVTVGSNRSVTASCTHAMIDANAGAMPPVAQHLVTTMYARDAATNQVIHLVEFVTRGPDKAATASTTFAVPATVKRIRVYAYCNQHDLWASSEIDVA
jgi:desulfoferrodoxin (superoxide reductase-like protein)